MKIKFFDVVNIIVVVFSAVLVAGQVYLERQVGAISTKGQAWQLSDPKTFNDQAIQWALTELAPCYDLTNLYYLPKEEYGENNRNFNIDKIIANIEDNRGWAQCQAHSFSFSSSTMQKFTWLQGTFCPNDKDGLNQILDFISVHRKSVVFSKSYFVCVSFAHSHLAGMTSRETIFAGSLFTESDLSNSVWSGSDLRHSVFSSANLENAQFTNVKLDGADFQGANLSGAKFVRAQLNGSENFEDADVTRADLRGLSSLTEKSLSQLCVRSGQPSPALPDHLAGRTTEIRKCSH